MSTGLFESDDDEPAGNDDQPVNVIATTPKAPRKERRKERTEELGCTALKEEMVVNSSAADWINGAPNMDTYVASMRFSDHYLIRVRLSDGKVKKVDCKEYFLILCKAILHEFAIKGILLDNCFSKVYIFVI
jgi:hypothetical protein